MLGTDDLYAYLTAYSLELTSQLDDIMGRWLRQPWQSWVDKATKTKHLCNVDAVDFLDKLLVMDHEDRLMPQDAMKHPYLLKLDEMTDPREIPGTPEYDQFH